MFKIEIKDDNKIIKKKIYESELQYCKWFEIHKERYKSCYKVTGFEQSKNGIWKEIM